MGKFFKSPIGFTGIFMGGKYILFIAVVFLITCTACSGQKEKTGNGGEKGGAIRKETVVTDQGGTYRNG